jgi:transcriptional regulator with PAS, ATPase and Fis domain
MGIDDISTEMLLNIILDEVDDIIVLNDSERNVIWLNRAAKRHLNISLENAVGRKCYELFGATSCCDNCVANHMLGGPRRSGCKFKCRNMKNRHECTPVPYYKEGKLKMVVQHIRPADNNE